MFATLMLLIAEPVARTATASQDDDRVSRSAMAVQEFFDEIVPRVEKPPEKPFDIEVLRLRRMNLEEQFGKVESASVRDNISVSVRDGKCFGGECAKLLYGRAEDRKELLRIAEDVFRQLGLYGDNFGFGNYPRPAIPRDKINTNLRDIMWINWSACQGKTDPYNRLWCTTDYNNLFLHPVSLPDQPFYVLFKTNDSKVSDIEIAFHDKLSFEKF